MHTFFYKFFLPYFEFEVIFVAHIEISEGEDFDETEDEV